MSDYVLQDFQSYFQQFTGQLERHRRKCLTIFRICTVTAMLSIILLPWYAGPLSEFLNSVVLALAGGHWKAHASPSDILSVTVFITGGSLFFMVWPIFSYRGSNKSAGMAPRDYSFKDYVYSHLLKYFGNFEFAPEGGLLAADLADATIIPPYHTYLAEDYIKGIVNESTVRIAETEMAQIRNKERVAVFKGLVVLIHISGTHVKLRGTFNGKTVLIADPQKKLPEIASKYASYQHFDLEDKKFDEEFEAYTTDPHDARKLLSRPFIESMLSLHQVLSNVRAQYEHFDDKIAYAARAILDYIKLPSGKSIAEKEYDANYGIDLDISKEDAISMDARYINGDLQAEFYGDKVLVTIPCKNDLFETNSLFRPALTEEDGMILFTLMKTVQEVTGQVKTYFETR